MEHWSLWLTVELIGSLVALSGAIYMLTLTRDHLHVRIFARDLLKPEKKPDPNAPLSFFRRDPLTWRDLAQLWLMVVPVAGVFLIGFYGARAVTDVLANWTRADSFPVLEAMIAAIFGSSLAWEMDELGRRIRKRRWLQRRAERDAA